MLNKINWKIRENAANFLHKEIAKLRRGEKIVFCSISYDGQWLGSGTMIVDERFVIRCDHVFLHCSCDCCRSDQQTGSVDSAGISKSDGTGTVALAGRYGSRCWPTQLNVVDVDHEQTGIYYSVAVVE